MRLRHKKPINSYKGQVSHDSNELYDEDFEKNPALLRKSKLPKLPLSTDPHKRSAEILVQFLNSINEDYRSHLKKFSQAQPLQPSYTRVEGQGLVKKTREGCMEKGVIGKELNGIKQQYNSSKKVVEERRNQKREVRDKKYKTIIQTKKIEEKPSEKNIDNLPAKNNQNNPPSQPKPIINPPEIKTSKPQSSTVTPPNPPSQQNNPTPPTKTQTEQQTFPYLMNMPNNVYQMGQLNYPQLLQLQMMNSQPLIAMMNNGKMTTLPVQFQQIQMDNTFNQMNLLNGCVPFSNLAFINQNMFSQAQQNRQNPQSTHKKNQSVAQKKSQPPKVQPPKAAKSAPKMQPRQAQASHQPPSPPQQKTQPPPEQPNESSDPPPDFKKRASYHVATAYNIHYNELKKQGKIPRSLEAHDLNPLDPTFNAKRVRDRKKSDNLSGVDIVES